MRSRRPIALWIAAILAPALILTFAVLQLRKTGNNPERISQAVGFTIGNFVAQPEEVRKPSPKLKGEDLFGRPLDLKSYRGKVVVLNLWGSWCGPCRREQPALVRLSNELEPRGVQFLGLNVRDNKAAAIAFRDEFHVTYPSFYDPSAELTYRLATQILPTTYLIDRAGLIVLRFPGSIDENLLRRSVETVLGAAT